MLWSQLSEEVVNLSLGEQKIFFYSAGLYFECSATSYILTFPFWSGDQLQYCNTDKSQKARLMLKFALLSGR